MEELFSFLIFLVIGLIVIGFLVIKTSGWDKLAKKYAYRKKFKGRLFRVITAYVGMVTYRNTIGVGVSTLGLYLNPFPFFRVGYPPVLIPWSEVSDFKIKQGFLGVGQKYVLQIGSPKLTTVTLPSRVFQGFPGIIEYLSNQNNLPS